MSRSEWQRVSPIAIIYFVFDTARQAVNLWPGLVALLAGGQEFRAQFMAYGLPALLALFVGSVLLHFWFFRYRVESDRIHLHSGVFNRKRLTLYFERVQQADIAQPFYFRPFGLATLGLESAGSRQQEVDIPGLPLGAAQSLKDRILAQRQALQSPELPEQDAAECAPTDYQLRLSWREVARYGLMYNGLLILAPVIAPFLQYLGPSLEQWLLTLEGTALHDYLLNLGNSGLAWLLGLITVAGILSGLLLLFFISVLIALLRFWNYHLTRVGDQFQYRAGFGTVKTRGFRLHKLQQVTVSQGLVARWLKRSTLGISKAGAAAPAGDEQHNKRFLVPVLNDENLSAMKRQLGMPEATWQAISPLYIAWRGGFLSLLAAGILLALPLDPWLPYLLPLSTFGCFLAAWRLWHCFGVYQDRDWLAVKTGFVGSKCVWLPLVKLQKIVVSEPPWLKPWRLAHLSLWGADARIDLPYIPRSSASMARDQSLYRVVTFRDKWF